MLVNSLMQSECHYIEAMKQLVTYISSASTDELDTLEKFWQLLESQYQSHIMSCLPSVNQSLVPSTTGSGHLTSTVDALFEFL